MYIGVEVRVRQVMEVTSTGIWQSSHLCHLKSFLCSTFQLQHSAAPALQSCAGTFDKSCTFKKPTTGFFQIVRL